MTIAQDPCRVKSGWPGSGGFPPSFCTYPGNAGPTWERKTPDIVRIRITDLSLARWIEKLYGAGVGIADWFISCGNRAENTVRMFIGHGVVHYHEQKGA